MNERRILAARPGDLKSNSSRRRDEVLEEGLGWAAEARAEEGTLRRAHASPRRPNGANAENYGDYSRTRMTTFAIARDGLFGGEIRRIRGGPACPPEEWSRNEALL